MAASRMNPDLDGVVPIEVSEYLTKLERALNTKNRAGEETSDPENDLSMLYEKGFKEVSEACGYGYDAYAKPPVYRPWPWVDAKAIAELGLSPRTLTLYKFLCCKHLFVDRNVSWQTAAKGWETFLETTAMLLKPNNGDLLNGIIWDMFDEFVFQLAQVYHRRLIRRRELRDTWSIAAVYSQLHTLISQSGIHDVLSKIGSGSVSADRVLSVSANHQALAAGFFAIITLARVDVLLGDHDSALRRLAPLSIPTCGRQYFNSARVDGAAPAHISLYYQIGFCYLMLHRFVDAAVNFRICLSVKASARKFSDRLQADAASFYCVACIFGGQHAEDVSGYLDERVRQTFDDEVRQLSAGQHEKFREVFSRCSPKFISIAPHGHFGEGTALEAKEQQTRLFMREVMQQLHIIALRGYFQVYSTISAEKIHSLLSSERAGEEVLDGNAALISMKYKSKQLVHGGVSPDLLSGTFKASASLGLVIEGSSVQVLQVHSEAPIEVKYAQRIEEVQRRMEKRAATFAQAVALRAASV